MKNRATFVKSFAFAKPRQPASRCRSSLQGNSTSGSNFSTKKCQGLRPRQEIEEQWRLYDGFDPVLECKLRARIKRGVNCHWRFVPRMVVIPPGIEFHHILPRDEDIDGDMERNEENPTSDPSIWEFSNINPAFIEPFGLTLIEAAAYGLPIVATKNGGHIDIHKVLDNGALVDPHDQQFIADALLKLVSDKQLWAR
ncbi:hypothetical protein V6N13_045795 [Hibiscus sabdariffa]|uniref:sucrose-phosphate synthase n=1 Tax=Hibiscus sabdariffa TaxID=183260 RepID=A0ABR2NI37_9ROSI